MKRYWLLLVILVISVISIILVWNLPSGRFNETLPVVVTVSEPGQIEVNMTREPQKAFNFGNTFPGTKIQKTMNLSRGNEPPASIHITVNGAVKNWITIDKNDFILDEPDQVNVTITIPYNAESGTYTGNITINYISTYFRPEELISLNKVLNRFFILK